ncbi:hypothetical protein [Oryza sativa Japonica Group]|uniref:Uncharacterized protein n=2 Tax=Oryza sativa subsp. japonica TaxID=39947 RepID=Q7F768_ORYSJ|nr:hypothetical protein [Oryza sativa Japonica Group]BAB63475.1 hypothetical protein [Oryza sativa Japonica Group]
MGTGRRTYARACVACTAARLTTTVHVYIICMPLTDLSRRRRRRRRRPGGRIVISLPPPVPHHLAYLNHRIATSSFRKPPHTPNTFFVRFHLFSMELSSSASSVCSAYRHLSSSSAMGPTPRRRRRGKVVGGGCAGVGLAGRCNAVLKEHKTRLYILGRILDEKYGSLSLVRMGPYVTIILLIRGIIENGIFVNEKISFGFWCSILPLDLAPTGGPCKLQEVFRSVFLLQYDEQYASLIWTFHLHPLMQTGSACVRTFLFPYGTVITKTVVH